MAHFTTDITWERGDQDFLAGRYSRRHQLQFDGGADMPGSSSPHVVPPPWSDAAAIDPEEMFVAAIASCHMLWFLSIAAKRRYCVDSYRDHAVGEMGQNAYGKLVVTRVTLHPSVSFSSARQPDSNALNALHHEAHDECFIANSVLTEIVCEPVLV